MVRVSALRVGVVINSNNLKEASSSYLSNDIAPWVRGDQTEVNLPIDVCVLRCAKRHIASVLIGPYGRTVLQSVPTGGGGCSQMYTFPCGRAGMLQANAIFNLEMQAALCRAILGVRTLNPEPSTLNHKPYPKPGAAARGRGARQHFQ